METDFLTLRDGKKVRIGRWSPTGDGRGTVVLLHGRSEFLEKYQETADDLLARGFAVFSFDWRGQGLSDRVLPERQKGHIDDFEIWVADLDEILTYAAATGPVILLGHSMGGHLALRFMAEHPRRTDAAILTAPMIDILPGAFARWTTRTAAALAVRRGFATRYAPGHGDYDPSAHRFEGNRLTSDPARFEVHRAAFRERPELRLGGVTWGWLDASFRSATILRDPSYAGGIDRPVLLLSAGIERLVSNAAQHEVAKALPLGIIRTYPESLHEILMERDAIRNRFWSDFDTFLGDNGLPA